MTSPMAVTYNYNGIPANLVLGSANNARYAAVILDEFYIYEHALPSNTSSSVYWNYFLNWKFVLPTCRAERHAVIYVILWFWIAL